ncbi:hypothetical protein VTO73DRAFT_13947 [Trametes versicolor]
MPSIVLAAAFPRSHPSTHHRSHSSPTPKPAPAPAKLKQRITTYREECTLRVSARYEQKQSDWFSDSFMGGRTKLRAQVRLRTVPRRRLATTRISNGMGANLLYRPAVTFDGSDGVTGEPCCVRPRPSTSALKWAQGGVLDARRTATHKAAHGERRTAARGLSVHRGQKSTVEPSTAPAMHIRAPQHDVQVVDIVHQAAETKRRTEVGESRGGEIARTEASAHPPSPPPSSYTPPVPGRPRILLRAHPPCARVPRRAPARLPGYGLRIRIRPRLPLAYASAARSFLYRIATPPHRCNTVPTRVASAPTTDTERSPISRHATSDAQSQNGATAWRAATTCAICAAWVITRHAHVIARPRPTLHPPGTPTMAPTIPPNAHSLHPTPSPHMHTSSLSSISSTPSTPASSTTPGGGLTRLNSKVSSFMPKHIVIKSESG